MSYDVNGRFFLINKLLQESATGLAQLTISTRNWKPTGGLHACPQAER